MFSHSLIIIFKCWQGARAEKQDRQHENFWMYTFKQHTKTVSEKLLCDVYANKKVTNQ